VVANVFYILELIWNVYDSLEVRRFGFSQMQPMIPDKMCGCRLCEVYRHFVPFNP